MHADRHHRRQMPARGTGTPPVWARTSAAPPAASGPRREPETRGARIERLHGELETLRGQLHESQRLRERALRELSDWLEARVSGGPRRAEKFKERALDFARREANQADRHAVVRVLERELALAVHGVHVGETE